MEGSQFQYLLFPVHVISLRTFLLGDCQSWNIPTTHGKELSMIIDKICTEYSNVKCKSV